MRPVLLLIILASALASQTARTSLEDLFRLFTESLASDAADSETAAALTGVTLARPVPSDTLQVLQAMGVGPLTLQTLSRLSAQAPALAPLAEPFAALGPAPDPAREAKIVKRITDYADRYVHALPDFLCTQTTRYYQSGRLPKEGHAHHEESARGGNWRLDQTITEQVRYHDGAEEYTTQLVNGQPDQTPIAQMRDSYSRGEFGGVLGSTFDRASQARFQWDHWETIAGRHMAVLRYSVPREHSQYTVCCLSAGTVTIGGIRHRQQKTWISAYQGTISAEPDSGVIARFTYRNIEIPAASTLDDARNLVEYTPITAGGRTGWLPSKVIHYTRQGAFRTRSDSQFSNYHGFGATSTLQFPTEDKP